MTEASWEVFTVCLILPFIVWFLVYFQTKMKQHKDFNDSLYKKEER
jgi:hypothetical protein